MNASICALLSGAMFYFSYGLDDVWQLAWFAPAPLLWLACGDGPRWQLIAATFFASAMGTLYFFQAYGTYVLIDGIVILIGNGFLLAASVLLAGWTWRSVRPAIALFAFPVLWTSIEFLESLVSPHGAWGAIGYSQVDWPAAIQVASVTGIYGVTFILCVFASALALMFRGARLTAGLGLALTIVVIAGGYVRLASALPSTLRVAALADVVPNGSRDTDLDVANRYASAIRAEAAKGAKVFVTPETGLETNGLAPIEAAAHATGTLVVAGVHNRAPERNMAVAFVPGGQAMTYDKRHRLLPEEGKSAPGTRSGFIGNGMATAICKDLDFPRTIRSDARAGIRLMIVPANDFYLDDWMHARQAVMRGVENGFAVSRTAFHGLATVSDDRGRILAIAKVRQPGFVVARADVPLGTGPTLYTRFGDWFAWLCVALAIALPAPSLIARLRASKATTVDPTHSAR